MRFLLSMALAFLLLAAMAVALMTGSAAAQAAGQYQIVPLPQPLGEGRAVSAPSSGILPAACLEVALGRWDDHPAAAPDPLRGWREIET